jgi:hypothetical protein
MWLGGGVVWVVVGLWVGVDRIAGEVVLYAHEVWNRGVKRLCGGECAGMCEGRVGGGVYGMDRDRVRGGSA